MAFTLLANRSVLAIAISLMWAPAAFVNAQVQCFDIITANTKLTGDISCACGGNSALVVEGPATLDLKGYTVSCTDAATRDPNTEFPSCVQLVGDDAKVKNGIVTQCAQGIGAEDTTGAVVTDITATLNDVGMYFDSATGSKVKDSQVLESFFFGILALGGGGGNVITDSVVSQVTLFEGIALLGSDNNKVTKSVVEMISGFGFDPSSGSPPPGCIGVYPAAGFSDEAPTNNEIKNNQISNCAGNGVFIFSSDSRIIGNMITETTSAAILSGLDNTLIKNNQIHDCESDAISHSRGSGAIIKGNIVSDVGGDGVDLFLDSTGATVTGNVFVNCGGQGLDIGTDGNTLKNNVIENCETGILIATNAIDNTIKNNEVLDSTLLDVSDGNVNCGTNIWKNNWFTTFDLGCIA